MAVDIERGAHGVHDPGRQRGRFGTRAHVALEDGEFVSPEAGHRIGLTHETAQANADLLQELVAERMSEGIVDVLEVVEVQAKDGKLVTDVRPGEMLFHFYAEQMAIGQIGQLVVQGHMRDPGLRLSTFGHVLMRCRPAASGHGLVDHEYVASIGRREDALRDLALRQLGQKLVAKLFRIRLQETGLGAVLQHVANRATRLNDLGRQAVHLDEPAVADNDPMRRIEHDEALDHVVDGGIEPNVLGLEHAECPVQLPVAGPEAFGVLAGSPDVGRDRSGQQNAANQHDPGAHIVWSDRAAGDRDGNHRPGGIAHGERTRPVQTTSKRTLRVRADRNHLRARAVKVKRRRRGHWRLAAGGKK